MLRAAMRASTHRCEQCARPGAGPGTCTACDGVLLDPQDPEAARWLRTLQATQARHSLQRLSLQAVGIFVIATMLVTGAMEWSVWGPQVVGVTARIPFLRSSTARMMIGLSLEARWSGVDLSDQSLLGVSFDQSDLSDARLRQTTWYEPKVWSTALLSTDLSESHWMKGDLRSCTARDADFSGSTLSETSFNIVDLSGADFSGATLEDVSFWTSELIQADLSGATFADVTFGGVDLRGANLSGADLRDVTFHEYYRSRSTDLSGADLRCADLTGVKLAGIPLTDADLRGAILTDAQISPLRLEEARLDPDYDCEKRPQ